MKACGRSVARRPLDELALGIERHPGKVEVAADVGILAGVFVRTGETGVVAVQPAQRVAGREQVVLRVALVGADFQSVVVALCLGGHRESGVPGLRVYGDAETGIGDVVLLAGGRERAHVLDNPVYRVVSVAGADDQGRLERVVGAEVPHAAPHRLQVGVDCVVVRIVGRNAPVDVLEQRQVLQGCNHGQAVGVTRDFAQVERRVGIVDGVEPHLVDRAAEAALGKRVFHQVVEQAERAGHLPLGVALDVPCESQARSQLLAEPELDRLGRNVVAGHERGQVLTLGAQTQLQGQALADLPGVLDEQGLVVAGGRAGLAVQVIAQIAVGTAHLLAGLRGLAGVGAVPVKAHIPVGPASGDRIHMEAVDLPTGPEGVLPAFVEDIREIGVGPEPGLDVALREGVRAVSGRVAAIRLAPRPGDRRDGGVVVLVDRNASLHAVVFVVRVVVAAARAQKRLSRSACNRRRR